MSYRFRDRGNTGVTIKGVLITLAVFFCSFHSSVSAHQRGPDEEYRVWIENEVDPIISEEERGFFSSLDNNGEKEKFVKAFWKSLDPTPGTGTNEFKNEHYRRLQIAVTRFSLNGKPGTDTIRGKVYVKLGEPVQILNYNSPSLVSYVEAWLYPPSSECGIKYPFYVLFYIPDEKDQYDIYVPGVDDPYQLLATRYPGSRRQMNEYALKSLFRIDPVLGQLSLNLIPSEHRPIMHNNDTELRRALSRVNKAGKKMMRDLVSRPYLDAEERLSRIIDYMEGATDALTFQESSFSGDFQHSSRIYRNEKGNPTYYVSAFIPSKDVLIRESFGKCYSFLKVSMEAYDQRNFLVNSKEEYISAAYSSWEIFNKSAPSLCYEGFLELPQGEYRLEVKISNQGRGKAFAFRENIEISPKRGNEISLTKPSLLLKHVRKDYHLLRRTYSFGNKDIHPGPDARIARGQDAEVYFQLYFPRRDRVSSVSLRYMITYRSRVLWRGKETLGVKQLMAGNFFSRAIKLPTAKLHTGKYNLVITAKTLSPPEARTTLELSVVSGRTIINRPIIASVTK